MVALDGGVVETSPELPLERRLERIHSSLAELIDWHQPAAMALEDLYFGKNVHSAMAVGRASGAAMLAAAQRGVHCFTYTPQDPHHDTLWVFVDLSEERKVNSALRGSMTPRERDIAALLIEGRTGKEVAKALGISHRTVDIYKTRLLRKYGVSSTPQLVQHLLAG